MSYTSDSTSNIIPPISSILSNAGTTNPNGLSVQQVMGLELKDLGKRISNMTISKEVMLVDKFNYNLWSKAFTNSLRYVDRGLSEYMTSESPMNNIYEEAGEMLLARYVNENIFADLKAKGIFGRDIYKEIVKKYGRLTVHDKIRHAIELSEKATNSSIPVSKAITLGKRLDRFLHSVDETEKEALEHLVRINQGNSDFVEKYLALDNPKLSIAKIEEYVERSPTYLNEKTQVLAYINQSDETAVKGTDKIWEIQCYRCFGLGHDQSGCVSPERIGPIPDLETKLMQFKTKRRKFNKLDEDSDMSPNKRTANMLAL